MKNRFFKQRFVPTTQSLQVKKGKAIIMEKRSFNMEAIEKLIEAKRLEKEAFLMLFPDHVKEHLNVIGKEIKAMLVECLMEESFDKTDEEKKENQKKDEEKVKKVDIG